MQAPITSILDRRISHLVWETSGSDPLSPQERDRLKELLHRRNVCADAEVDAIDHEIITIVAQYATEDAAPPRETP